MLVNKRIFVKIFSDNFCGQLKMKIKRVLTITVRRALIISKAFGIS